MTILRLSEKYVKMTKLLIIGYVWPEPASTAAGVHILSLVELFQGQGWEVTFASPAAGTEHRVDLESLGVRCVDIELNSSSFDAFAQQLQPEVVLFDRFLMEEQFGWRVEKSCPGALRVLDTEDLSFLRHARHDALKKYGVINPDLTPALLYTELAQREVASILRSDLSLIISEPEMRLLTELFGINPALLHYYPLCPAHKIVPHETPGYGQRAGFITIGNYRHPPNWDAVRWLKEAIWPQIRSLLPGAECRVYGAYTPPKATALHKPEQGFHIMGWASDATEVMQKARVNLAPLRFGAGLKGKLVEGMACGTPSATTSIGAEGLAGELPFAGAVSDQPEDLACQAVALYQDEKLWQTARDNGFAIVQQRLDQRVRNQALFDRVQGLRTQLEEHRLQNFTGAMLRHHFHKSTQYMSQWIEAKSLYSEGRGAAPGSV
jgi:glycosyltransferase involved in cell wall biosynthesis